MGHVVALLEEHPDWIQLTNAVTIKSAQCAQHVVMLRAGSTDLSALGLTPQDTLFLLGHGDTATAGDFSAKALADMLATRRLPRGHGTIRMTSCEAGLENDGTTFIGELVTHLHVHGYTKVRVLGAEGLAISGWGVDHVVQPHLEHEYGPHQNRAEGANAKFILKAKALAGRISVASTEQQIIAAGNAIAQLTDYFYEHLALHAAHTLVPRPSTGFRVAH
jgi:hypothetical protein